MDTAQYIIHCILCTILCTCSTVWPSFWLLQWPRNGILYARQTLWCKWWTYSNWIKDALRSFFTVHWWQPNIKTTTYIRICIHVVSLTKYKLNTTYVQPMLECNCQTHVFGWHMASVKAPSTGITNDDIKEYSPIQCLLRRPLVSGIFPIRWWYRRWYPLHWIKWFLALISPLRYHFQNH